MFLPEHVKIMLDFCDFNESRLQNLWHHYRHYYIWEKILSIVSSKSKVV